MLLAIGPNAEVLSVIRRSVPNVVTFFIYLFFSITDTTNSKPHNGVKNETWLFL